MNNNLKSIAIPQSLWSEILESEEYLLHFLDIEKGHFGFIKTSRELLSQASFIDGRSQISIDQTLWYVPIEDALAWHAQADHTERLNRYIFHSAFCGSTLLGRMLDIPGKTYVHKEPSILAQLADLKLARHEIYLNTESWANLLGFVSNQLNLPLSEGEVNLIKPSNWVNSELRDLTILNGSSKFVLLSQSPMQFLTAVFRGGSERIEYVYSFLSQIRRIFPEFHDVIEEVENNNFETVDLFSRLTIIAYAIQLRAFSQVIDLAGVANTASYSYDKLMSDPETSILQISNLLHLNLTEVEISNSIKTHLPRHSKVQSRPYRQDEMVSVDKEVLSHYQQNFDSSIDWIVSRMDSTVLGIVK